MAKSIKRWGITPIWGLEHPEMTDIGSGEEEQVLLANSVDWNNTNKDFEQTNHLGQVQGYMIYDGQMDWSLNATVNNAYKGTFQSYYAPAMELMLSNALGRALLESETGLGYDPDDAVSILKSESISQTSDGAATLSLSGTLYYFGGEGDYSA